MTPTEALEQALGMDEPLAPDVLTALAALGYGIIKLPTWHPIHQAAEAADREAAVESSALSGPERYGTSAAADLDVEAVAAGFNAVFDARAWDDPVPVFAAAYAAAKAAK